MGGFGEDSPRIYGDRSQWDRTGSDDVGSDDDLSVDLSAFVSQERKVFPCGRRYASGISDHRHMALCFPLGKRKHRQLRSDAGDVSGCMDLSESSSPPEAGEC